MAKILHGKSPLWLAAAAIPAAFAVPAQAQSASASAASLTWSKSDAILGAPSALEAILAKQQAPRAPARALLRPASYSIPSVTPAILREPEAISPGVLSGRPDVFGSVALPLRTSRLSARWDHVENAGIRGAGADYARSLAGLGKVARLEAVNRYVNHRVRFVDDSRQYGRADVWSTATETLARGRGDCEDYAIAKLQMLRRAGFSDRDLYLVVVKDLVSRADHAVLVARSGEHMYVLDNGTDRLFDSDSVRDYRPILTFAANGTWTHGYRIESAPMNIASADDVSRSPLAPGADNQRSRSASLLAFNTGFSK